MTRALLDVNREIDHLYQLPLREFIGARNALATRLRHAGNEAAASQVKQLAKPTLSAWLVNQLYWQARSEFDRLAGAGDRLREAQQQRLAGNKTVDLQKAMQARQQTVDALLERAMRLARETGTTITPPTRQRVATTLDAITVHGSAAARRPVGRLTADLEPAGLAALASLTFASPIPVEAGEGRPSKGGSSAEPRPDRTSPRAHGADDLQAQRAEARAAANAAEADLTAHRRAATDADRAETRARARAAAADKRVRRCHAAIAEARRTLDAALEEASGATDALAAARSEAVEAAKSLREAEWRLRQARATLERLSKSTGATTRSTTS
ncbi:MAG: hypothetical protein GEU99_01050 [Luteitalea sp.]|nr:hypothetical protein [Luteitalea sp.]